MEPLMRIVKKAELPAKKVMLLRIGAIALALIAGGLFVLSIGYNPIEVYKTFITGCFRSKMAVESTLKFMIPLVITSLGVTLAFKMLFWNIGAEGQIIMGAVCATYFALFHSDWNHVVLLIVMFLAGMIGGGLWGLIPAFFKIKFNTNETLLTLMLNYIALYIVYYLCEDPWRDPTAQGYHKIAYFNSNAFLDKIFGVHAGWLVAIVLAVFVYVYLKYSKHGYEIAVVGESKETARYAGMNVKKIIIRTMFLSGGICGICGMVQATGADHTLTNAVAGGVGFTAIIIAWLAQLNPIGIIVVAAFFSILEKGSGTVQTAFGLSADSADVLQGIVLFFFLACEFFIRYKFVFRKGTKKGGSEA